MWRVVSRASPGSGPLPPGAPRRRRGADPAPAPDGGARPLRAGTGRVARWAPRSRASGAAPAPALVPGPHRAARLRAARTPAARGALGPCHRASPGAAAAPGPGSGRHPPGAQRRSRALPPGPLRLIQSVRSRCATPARPLASGAPPPSSSPQPTQPRPAARTDADADSQRARAPRPRARARPPGDAPRSPRAREGVPSGPAHARWVRRAGGGAARWRLRREVWWRLERFHPPRGFCVDLSEPEPGGSTMLMRSPSRRDPVDCAGGCCLILHRGTRESSLCLLVPQMDCFRFKTHTRVQREGEPGAWALSHISVTLNTASDSPLR